MECDRNNVAVNFRDTVNLSFLVKNIWHGHLCFKVILSNLHNITSNHPLKHVNVLALVIRF